MCDLSLCLKESCFSECLGTALAEAGCRSFSVTLRHPQGLNAHHRLPHEAPHPLQLPRGIRRHFRLVRNRPGLPRLCASCKGPGKGGAKRHRRLSDPYALCETFLPTPAPPGGRRPLFTTKYTLLIPSLCSPSSCSLLAGVANYRSLCVDRQVYQH